MKNGHFQFHNELVVFTIYISLWGYRKPCREDYRLPTPSGGPVLPRISLKKDLLSLAANTIMPTSLLPLPSLPPCNVQTFSESLGAASTKNLWAAVYFIICVVKSSASMQWCKEKGEKLQKVE